MTLGDLFILSAPSGAGKTTLIRKLLSTPDFAGGNLHFSVSHTTRAPRRGEADGVAYHFVDRKAFEASIEADGFLEWAEVHGNYYGTSKDEVLPVLEAGRDVLLDLDVQGAEILMRRFPDAASVFILPPSLAELRRRLTGRGLDDAATVERRLAVALSEMQHFERYRYAIVNDDAGRAGAVLASIILARRHYNRRMRPQYERIVASFDQPDRAAGT
jgi:guanylate kinase